MNGTGIRHDTQATDDAHSFTAEEYGQDTLLVHAGLPAHRSEGAAIMPIYQSATFGHHGFLGSRPAGEFTCFYTRPADNPNHRVLGAKLAALEGTEDAVVLSSGMAAVATSMLTLLQPGDHFLTQSQLYGASHALFHKELIRLGMELTIIDTSDPASWQAALRPNTKVFYVESCSNPRLEVGDLKAVVAFCRQHQLTSVIDSTFTPPVNFRPAAIGFDVIVHSATKYLNGHSDIVAGVIASTSRVIAECVQSVGLHGGVMDPHACFLLQRGLATLGLRVRQQNATGLAAAQYLAQHPKIKQVFYPGLSGSPGHELAKELFSGFGGVLAAELYGGEKAATTFIHALKIPLIAVSLGGIESLVCVPAQTTHKIVGAAGREAAGISDSLVRMAFGIEDTADLIRDLEQALSKVDYKKGLSNGVSHELSTCTITN